MPVMRTSARPRLLAFLAGAFFLATAADLGSGSDAGARPRLREERVLIAAGWFGGSNGRVNSLNSCGRSSDLDQQVYIIDQAPREQDRI